MMLLTAFQSLFTAKTPAAPLQNWQAPPPMSRDALGGSRARTVRQINCPAPEFLPRPSYRIER